MIRLVRLFTGADGQSHFEEGNAPMVPPGLAVDRSRKAPATTIYFEESAAGSSLDWHNDPHRRYVITLTGTVEFETRVGQTFTLFQAISCSQKMKPEAAIAGVWSATDPGAGFMWTYPTRTPVQL